MSQAEIKRFAEDLRSSKTLWQEIDEIAIDPLPSVVKIARSRGYDFTLDEARDFIKAKAHAGGKTLSDQQLDQMAGGMISPGEAINVAGHEIGHEAGSIARTIASWF